MREPNNEEVIEIIDFLKEMSDAADDVVKALLEDPEGLVSNPQVLMATLRYLSIKNQGAALTRKLGSKEEKGENGD